MSRGRFKGTVLEDSDSDNKSDGSDASKSDMNLAGSSTDAPKIITAVKIEYLNSNELSSDSPVKVELIDSNDESGQIADSEKSAQLKENKPTPPKGTARQGSDFIIQRMLKQAEQTTKFSHEVGQAKKAVRPDEEPSAKHENLWFKKFVKTLRDAEFELYGQELFRLFSPAQPKTRLVSDGDVHYIVSKAIPNAVSLDDLIDSEGKNLLAYIEENVGDRTIEELMLDDGGIELLRKINPSKLADEAIFLDDYGDFTLSDFIHKYDTGDSLGQKYYRLGLHIISDRLKDDDARAEADISPESLNGLGTISVLAMFGNEIDLKFGNILKNEENRLVKIDGDWLFAKLLGKGNFEITESQINALPLAVGYKAFNWLDQIRQEKLISSPKIVGGDGNTQLYAEINEALLKVILLPNELLVSLATGHKISSENTALLSNEVISRKQQTMLATLKYPGFEEYLASDAAQKVKTEFVKYLIEFKVQSKVMLVGEQDQARIAQAIDKAFNQLTVDVKAAKVAEPENHQRFAPK